MKTTVVVTVRIEREVYLDIECGEDDDPCSLTREEQQRAIAMADAGLGGSQTFDVVDVRQVQ